MPAGLQVWDADGFEMLNLTERFPQVVETIDLSMVVTPSSKSYPNINPTDLGFILYQGGGRARVVSKSGNTISWSFVNDRTYRAFSGTPRILVISG